MTLAQSVVIFVNLAYLVDTTVIPSKGVEIQKFVGGSILRWALDVKLSLASE